MYRVVCKNNFTDTDTVIPIKSFWVEVEVERDLRKTLYNCFLLKKKKISHSPLLSSKPIFQLSKLCISGIYTLIDKSDMGNL